MGDLPRAASEQLLDALKDSTLGPNQRARFKKGVSILSQPDPTQRPLAVLLMWILVLSMLTLAFILKLSGSAIELEELPGLVVDVMLLRRVPVCAQDNVAASVACFLCLWPLALVDYMVCARLFSDAGARWFLLHALGNLVVAVLSLPDFYYYARNPPAALAVSYCRSLPVTPIGHGCSDLPTCLIVAMHIYHMISFRLSAVDLFHHLLFVPLIGGIRFVYPWGTAGNLLSFFISGLPGEQPDRPR